MATTAAKTDAQSVTIRIPSALFAEVKELARKQEQPLEKLLLAAVRNYITSTQNWERLHAYGNAQAQKLGYTEDDVERLIAEVRQEHSKNAA